MLADNFYHTMSCTQEGNGAKATLKLNRQSPIFSGHFPEMPIVPGVCSVQMIQELVEKVMKKRLMLISADNLKFLGVINPDETPEIDIDVTFTCDDHGEIAATATIASKGTILLKFKGKFKC